jgi:hypothetical protein
LLQRWMRKREARNQETHGFTRPEQYFYAAQKP